MRNLYFLLQLLWRPVAHEKIQPATPVPVEPRLPITVPRTDDPPKVIEMKCEPQTVMVVKWHINTRTKPLKLQNRLFVFMWFDIINLDELHPDLCSDLLAMMHDLLEQMVTQKTIALYGHPGSDSKKFFVLIPLSNTGRSISSVYFWSLIRYILLVLKGGLRDNVSLEMQKLRPPPSQ